MGIDLYYTVFGTRGECTRTKQDLYNSIRAYPTRLVPNTDSFRREG